VTSEFDVCKAFIHAHPHDAARAIERLPIAQVAALVGAMPAETAAELLSVMAPNVAGECLARTPAHQAAAALTAVRIDRAAILLRHLDDPAAMAIIERLPAGDRDTLMAMLRYPRGTAGAMMDRRVVSTGEGTTAGHVLAVLRSSTRHLRDYIYVVDESHLLVGFVSLDELLIARTSTPVTSLMTYPVSRLSVHAGRPAILAHEGWRTLRALAVVDEQGMLLGAISHDVFRTLEQESAHSAKGHEAAATVFALGELYWLGLSGMVDALVSAVRQTSQPSGWRHDEGGSRGAF
jgi:magnesium transporter